MFDVVIIGGGPAGSTAGIVLADFGFDVLILDKSRFPRDKLCGGALTYKTELLLKQLKIEDYHNIIDYKTDQYSILWKKERLFEGYSKYKFSFVKRREYDYFLLKKAKQRGVKVLENEKVVDIDFDKNQIKTLSGRTFRYKYLIGADGVYSVVRKLMEKRSIIKKQNWKENLANAIEIYIDKKFLKDKITKPQIIFGYVKWGYSWIFPNKDRVVVGIGGLISKNKNLVDNFYSFLYDFAPDYKSDRLMGHPIPFGNFIEEPVFKNVLLVGDAGGITNPASGEGIYSAQKSAQLASLAIYEAEHQKGSLKELYPKYLSNSLYKEFYRDLKIRNIAYPFSNRFLTKWVFKFFNKKLEKIIHL
ncbi:MAG: NAD(P)/FAD-dependent oxidoreductase [Aquificae bacterium]|nr:NAD(P)/FAD-dependent oxidoreductase [Aquificota bacterium]